MARVPFAGWHRASWVGFALLLVASACGNTSSTTATARPGTTIAHVSTSDAPATTALSPPSTTTPSSTATTLPPATSGPPPTNEPLSTTGPSATTTQPPPVAGQFTAWVGGGDPPPCEPELWGGTMPELPFVGLGYEQLDALVGWFAPLCFVGFDTERPIDVMFTLPDGSERTTAFQPGPNEWSNGVDPLAGPVLTWGDTFWWLMRPHYERGRYALEARQEGTVATGAFEVVDSTEPWIESVTRSVSVDAAEPALFFLSGFEPGQLVQLAFYTMTDEFIASSDGQGDGYVFLLHDEVGMVQVDEHGVGVFEANASLLSPGRYCLTTPLIEFPDCADGGVLEVF